MIDLLSKPWPWYIAGPLFGLFVPLLLLAGGKAFGISGSYRPMCAATLPTRAAFFQYDWRSLDGWNLIFALGIVLGGAFAGTVLAPPDPVIAIAQSTRADIVALGITDFSGYVPRELVSWDTLLTIPGFLMLVGGGVLVGFGFDFFFSSVLTAGLTLQLLRRRHGLAPPPKEWGTGSRYAIGGVTFGIGWGLLSGCPGPIYALIGSGVSVLLVTLAAVLAGTWLYGVLRPRLPH